MFEEIRKIAELCEELGIRGPTLYGYVEEPIIEQWKIEVSVK